MVRRDHGLFRHEARVRGHDRGLELREVKVEDVVLVDEPGNAPEERGHQHTLADVQQYGRPDHLSAADLFPRGQTAVVARGNDRDLVASLDETFHDSLGVDGQAADVRGVVCERREDAHYVPENV